MSARASSWRRRVRGAVWTPSVLVLAIGLLVTTVGWSAARRATAATRHHQFVEHARQAEASVQREVRAHVELLEWIGTFTAATFPPTTSAFAYVVDQLRLPQRYPALTEILLVEKTDAAGIPALEARLRADGHPEFQVSGTGATDERLVLTQVVQYDPAPLPFGLGTDFAAFGTADILNLERVPEPSFVSVGYIVGQLGVPARAVSGRIGFYVIAPIRDRVAPGSSTASAGVLGWIVASVDGNRFLDEVAGSPPALDLALSVQTPGHSPEQLAHRPPPSGAAVDGGLERQSTFRIGATTWTLVVRGAGFGDDGAALPATVLTSGLLLTLLAASAVFGRRRATRRSRALATALAHRERWASVLLESASDPLVVLDADGVITYANPAAHGFLPGQRGPWTVDDLLDRIDAEARPWARGNLERVAATAGRTERFVTRVRRGVDEWVHLEYAVTNLLDDPAIRGIVIAARDITEHKRIEAILEHEAQHDPLTGLANRAYLYDRLHRALGPGRGPDLVGVLFVDLDDFKRVNDDLGHAIGDVLLRAVAERLQSAVRAADTVARLGGDEFVVLCEGITDPGQVTDIAGKLDRALAAPITVGAGAIAVTASIGVAVGRRAADIDADVLVGAADHAMYRAKQNGRHRIEVVEGILATATR